MIAVYIVETVCTLRCYLSMIIEPLSLHFNGHFPGNPSLLTSICHFNLLLLVNTSALCRNHDQFLEEILCNYVNVLKWFQLFEVANLSLSYP